MLSTLKISFYCLALIAQIISAVDIAYEHTNAHRLLLNDDLKLTNEDSRADVLSIDPLQITLSPTPESLSPDVIAKIKTILEDTILENLVEMGGALSTITSVTLNDVSNTKWVPGKRMLRHGRVMADGAFTDPYTVLDIPGGTANSTFSIYYSSPNEQELNNAILSILVRKASTSFASNGLDYEGETTVLPDERDEPINTEKSKNAGASVAVGVVVAFIVVIGAAYYARRNGTVVKLQQKYDIFKSNLRAWRDEPADDADLQVEVCSDNFEKGPYGGPSSPESVKSIRSVLSILSGNRSPLSAKDANATVEPTSPESVKTAKSILSISSLRSRKKVDESVQVEVCTDNIEKIGPESPLSTQSKTSTHSRSFSDGRQSPTTIRAREKKTQKILSPQDFTVEVNQD